MCDALNAAGQDALALHGDLEQRDRDQTLVRFAEWQRPRAGRHRCGGTWPSDIKSLELVVNYELAWEPEVHVHRIGRTARAGNSGLAISLCAPEEAQRANILSEMLQLKLNWLTAPSNVRIAPLEAEMATLCIDGGKKAKMRPGGCARCADRGYGVKRRGYRQNYRSPGSRLRRGTPERGAPVHGKQLQNGKIKGKACRVRLLK